MVYFKVESRHSRVRKSEEDHEGFRVATVRPFSKQALPKAIKKLELIVPSACYCATKCQSFLSLMKNLNEKLGNISQTNKGWSHDSVVGTSSWLWAGWCVVPI